MPRSRRALGRVLVVLVAVATSAGALPATGASADPTADAAPAGGPPVVGLIVTPTDAGLPDEVVDRTEDLLDADVTRATPTGDDSYALRLDQPVDAAEAADASARLTGRDDVAAVEPDYLVRTAAPSPVTTDDPAFSRQVWLWDAAAGRPGGWSTRAPAFWQDRGRGVASVVVAVIDTGITAHPDLAGQTVPGFDMISSAAVARDGGGRDADPGDRGDWMDRATARRCLGDPGAAAEDSSWHGTHVAGIVAARADNRLGMVGAAPGVRVQPVRALGRCGGSTSDVADAITWASGGAVRGAPANRTPADVVSLSLGSYGERCGATMQAAVDGARRRGTVVVAAAGNEFGDVRLSSPGSCAGVVSVAASTRAGRLASFSNRGAGVALAAPGTDVLSTINTGRTTPGPAAYALVSGTSQATPQVAAAAALVRSADPSATVATVERSVRAAVQPFAARTTGGGAGVLDLGRLVVAGTPPRVRGGTAVGSTLTAVPARWTVGRFVARQWRRDGRVVPGATGTTYRVTRADLGRRITVAEVAAGRAGGRGNPLASAAVVVPAQRTATRLTSSRTTARFGTHAVRLRAQVTVPGGTPTGSVTFYDGGTVLRTVRLGRGVAATTLGRRTLRPSTHRLRAVYRPGAPAWATSSSTRVTVRVRR
ncbi:MAG: S8 family serine peptidase [Nocardioidaceae bacterium]|nr:S8 family serine peptidase [Nocardioidaceae bacterium]